MPKVSVIMPCLNMAKYISQCLDTVIHQTLTNIEILLIDAGSTDGTIELIKEYEKNDSRVHIIHSDKKSYGYQMNLGVSMASGEYVGIVETDDMVQLDMFEVLYDKALESEADYVKGVSEGFYLLPDGMRWQFPIIPCRDLQEKSICIESPKNNPSLFLYDNFLWNGIYRKEFIQQIRFHETPGAAFQDIGVLFQIASTASKGVYVDHLVYYYRQDNLNASSYNKKSLVYAAVEYRYMEQFLKGLPLEWHKIYYLKLVGLIIDRFYTMAGSGEYWEESREKIVELHRKLQYAMDHNLICKEDCDTWQNLLWQDLCLFLKGPENFYKYIRRKYEENLKPLQELFQILMKQRKIYIFGAKQLGQFLHVVLRCWGVKNIEGYCDNNKELQGKVFQTKQVLSPEVAVEKNPQAYYVITSALHKDEMKSQLVHLGVSDMLIGSCEFNMDIRLLREKAVV